jgi:hypothetical protein
VRKKQGFKWVMKTEGKIPIIVSAEVSLSGNLKNLLWKNTHYTTRNFIQELTFSGMKQGTQLL